MKESINIGLFGYGVVAQGLSHVLAESKGINVHIKKICVRDPAKKRNLPEDMFTLDPGELINDPSINLVVELIDDADAAYQIVKRSIVSGKGVVTANKKMLARHLGELVELQKEHGVSLLYEPSSCGSIPIIRNLEEYYDNDLLLSVSGILNGSSNFILSKIFRENLPYEAALKQAQELGFAESDPTLDVCGLDALYKLIIITLHAFGVVVDPAQVLNYGISTVSEHDIRFAREKGYKIKLVARVRKVNEKEVTLYVIPAFVNQDDYIYNVEDQFNGVVIEGLFYDKQFMFGKGAGGTPTGSAVLSDITALLHDYRYEYKKMKYYPGLEFTNNIILNVYIRFREVKIVEKFGLLSITERYSGSDYNYLTGTVSLEKLIQIRDLLTDPDIFLVTF